MAAYSYKLVAHNIPEKYKGEGFLEKYSREYDGEGGYDGDAWVATRDWIKDLKDDSERLSWLLSNIHKKGFDDIVNGVVDRDDIDLAMDLEVTSPYG